MALLKVNPTGVEAAARPGAILAATLVLILQLVPRAWGNCALYGCTLSLSYTCSMDFYEGSFFPELAMSFEDDQLVPNGAGCAANHQIIVCPLAGQNKSVTTCLSYCAAVVLVVGGANFEDHLPCALP